MKILFLILGIFFTLTSESFSNEKDKPEMRSPKPRQEKVLRPPELNQVTSNSDTSNHDWLWGNNNPLASNESLTMPQELTFPRTIQNNNNPITLPSEKTKKQSTEEGIFLTADHMTRDNERGIIWAWGKVVIKTKGRVIKSDKVKVNTKTGNGEAVGHITITQSDGTRLKAKRTRFNINKNKGGFLKLEVDLVKNFILKEK